MALCTWYVFDFCHKVPWVGLFKWPSWTLMHQKLLLCCSGQPRSNSVCVNNACICLFAYVTDSYPTSLLYSAVSSSLIPRLRQRLSQHPTGPQDVSWASRSVSPCPWVRCVCVVPPLSAWITLLSAHHAALTQLHRCVHSTSECE